VHFHMLNSGLGIYGRHRSGVLQAGEWFTLVTSAAIATGNPALGERT
jgi:hypothetical protein